MKHTARKAQAYFSRSPDIFARYMNIGGEEPFFEAEIYPAETVASPTNKEFLVYWTNLAEAAGGVPSRKLFNPAKMRRVLPYISLIEQTDTDFHIRLSGTETDRVLGFTSGGRMLSELPSRLVAKWTPIYRQVLESGMPFLYRNLASNAANKLEMEAVCVPFRQNSAAKDDAPRLIMSTFDICRLEKRP